jgi:hypothetical protein
MSNLYQTLQTFKHNNETIPEYMHGGIVRYIENKLQPGDFLTGILTNDLYKAVAHADDTNKYLLFVYVVFFYNYAPSECWGNIEKVKKWLNKDYENKSD